jgi:hypothetical protein
MKHPTVDIGPAKWFPHHWCDGDQEASLVERIISNGTSQFAYQYGRCREPLCSPIKRQRAYEITGTPSIPRFAE